MHYANVMINNTIIRHNAYFKASKSRSVLPAAMLCGWFDFIECFTTTFLRSHSWLNWVDEDDDEDEVGLKEKPEDTRYIKKITSK